MPTPWWWPLGRVPELAAAELARRLAAEPNPQIVDVRTRLEYDAGHIAGARSSPILSFRQILPSLELDPRRPVYVICLTAHRSPPAVRMLRDQGFDAHQLASGMNAWWREKLPTTK